MLFREQKRQSRTIPIHSVEKASTSRYIFDYKGFILLGKTTKKIKCIRSKLQKLNFCRTMEVRWLLTLNNIQMLLHLSYYPNLIMGTVFIFLRRLSCNDIVLGQLTNISYAILRNGNRARNRNAYVNSQ